MLVVVDKQNNMGGAMVNAISSREATLKSVEGVDLAWELRAVSETFAS